ncbi:hypothetical protein F5148DRAFT_1323298 [Russula earlei]|uniref:Uncharacterized protein n=1 Tax=Russula earlei TaxID=71964 RepID=A0ACC0UI10_9AGAM|nr:hypothetical protein F5148DRAFT_1323298 [Russula earlei]
MKPVPLILPYTLSATSPAEGLPDAPSCANIVIEQASVVANVSCLAPWARASVRFTPSDSLEGIALGCEDGSLFLLRQSQGRHHISTPISLENPLLSRSPSPTSVQFSSRPRSRPRSPSTSLAPFSIASRARVVSGISDEQVQAPRNYVNFDEEPEKLKELLKGSAKDHSAAAIPKGPPSRSGSTRRGGPKSLLSATHSPALSLTSPPSPSHSAISSPSSPLYQHTLELHVFPTCSGPGNGVVGLHALASGRHLICLQSQGDLSVYSTNDGSCVVSLRIPQLPAVPPAGAKEIQPTEAAWAWRKLFIHEAGESSIIVTSATIDDGFPLDMSIDSEEFRQKQLSRVAVFELRENTDRGDDDMRLDKAAEWLIEGPCAGIGFSTAGDDAPTLFYVDSSNHLIVQRVVLVPAAIQLPPEFRGDNKRAASPDRRGEACRILLEDTFDVGELKPDQRLKGLQLLFIRDSIRGAAWSDCELYGFESRSQRLIINQLGTTHEHLKDITWFGWDTYCAIFSDRVQVSRLRLVDPNNDRLLDGQGSEILLQSHIVTSVAIHTPQALRALSPTTTLSTGVSSGGRRQVELYTCGDSRKEWAQTTLWKSYEGKKNPDDKRGITCLLPLEFTHVILGYSDGTIGRSSFANLVQLNSDLASEDRSDIPLNGCIVALHVVQNDQTGERLIVGGADDGSIAIWSLESMKTLARWILFITPLQRVLHQRYDKGGPLGGCLLCVSGDGTIAVIALENYSFLYMVPGSPAPLIRICIGGNNLLLLYADGRARLWDVKTLEFWRSMVLEKAKEVLGQGGWTELSLRDSPSMGNGPTTLGVSSPDASSTILVNLGSFLTRAVSISKSTAEDDQSHKTRERTAEVLRSLLQVLLTPGLNPDIDAICRDRLGLPATQALESRKFRDYFWEPTKSMSESCITETVPAKPPSDKAEHVNTVVAFYATALSHTIGRGYVPPSLSSLARWWFDVSSELRVATRILFDAGVAGLTDDETTSLVDRWQHSLPFLLPDSERRSPVASKALLLCGFIAAGQSSLLSTSALNIISKSVMIYLHENDLSCEALAIDLCSRGFNVWQNYIDSMEMLRNLFNLATSTKKESISAQNVGPQARQALLHIVTDNTGIFMTTLSLDILHPQSLEHRKSVMQLVAFLIRKKPLLIHPNLPKLVEAVVKSLDPNSTSNRDAVQDAATEILGHVVKTFPSIDFHMASQRLAVGTGEGAIVMYDLKTATRLYVLECHKQALVACSFSPDGRRLVTVSLEEGAVLVWKVGNSFASFFNPGAPPRQGHGGSEPFKSLSFNVGDAGEFSQLAPIPLAFFDFPSSPLSAVMSLEETFDQVQFEWTAERSVQLRIRDVTLTFSA